MGGIQQFTSVPCTPNMECIAHQYGVHDTPGGVHSTPV